MFDNPAYVGYNSLVFQRRASAIPSQILGIRLESNSGHGSGRECGGDPAQALRVRVHNVTGRKRR